MRTALGLLETSVQGLHDRGLLMSDYRGELLDEVMERLTESSGRARDLAGGLHGNLSTAHSTVGHLAYNEASEVPDQEPKARSWGHARRGVIARGRREWKAGAGCRDPGLRSAAACPGSAALAAVN
ncbi:hypothetical protein ACFZDK_50320 [Streptomyces sp. NPDC007901]|uniref:hypothetical protein n=1 Tax=Streptomyces sp. NPDC007901 TaxID=3364785 RepID=UPI0036E02DE8